MENFGATMNVLLQITLIAVLIALAAGLVPLLMQLRRTAHAMEILLASSRRDLDQITQDVHEVRLRMDALAGSLQGSLNELSRFTEAVGEIGRSLQTIHSRIHRVVDFATHNLGGLAGGISTVLALFKRRSKSTEHSKEIPS